MLTVNFAAFKIRYQRIVDVILVHGMEQQVFGHVEGQDFADVNVTINDHDATLRYPYNQKYLVPLRMMLSLHRADRKPADDLILKHDVDDDDWQRAEDCSGGKHTPVRAVVVLMKLCSPSMSVNFAILKHDARRTQSLDGNKR